MFLISTYLSGVCPDCCVVSCRFRLECSRSLTTHGHRDRRLFVYDFRWIAWFEGLIWGTVLSKIPLHALMHGSGHTLVNMQNKTSSCKLYPVVVSASGFDRSDSLVVTRQNSAELSLDFFFCHVSLKYRK